MPHIVVINETRISNKINCLIVYSSFSRDVERL
jgi:hypothetical protein